VKRANPRTGQAGGSLSSALIAKHSRVNPSVNALHRPPTAEQLYANGPPDIEIGTLVDAPDVRFGIRYLDRPRAILIAGSAGSGKTNLCLNIIEKTHELGQREPAKRISVLILPNMSR
jgi:hypothetical protein